MWWQWLSRFFFQHQHTCIEIACDQSSCQSTLSLSSWFAQLLVKWTLDTQVSIRYSSRLYNVKHVILNTKIILKGHISHLYFATNQVNVWLYSSLTFLDSLPLHCCILGFALLNPYYSSSLIISMTYPVGSVIFLSHKIRPQVWDCLIIWSRGMLPDFHKLVWRLRHSPPQSHKCCPSFIALKTVPDLDSWA